MSKVKEILTPEYALKDILKNLSEDDISEYIKKTKSLLYKYADPDDVSRQISFKDAMILDSKMEEIYGRKPFLRLLTDFLSVHKNFENPNIDEFLPEVIAIGGKVGDLMNRIKMSLDEKSHGGSKIVPKEKELIFEEINKIDDQLDKIKKLLKDIDDS